jgi:hypothetical protein
VLLAATAASVWLSLWAAGGPIVQHDTAGYLALADALEHGGALVAERPDRTPGYPLFLLACRGLAALGGWDALFVAAILQTILLSGLGTWLVFDGGNRIGGPVMAVAAALLYAGDVDLQVFGNHVMSEAQAAVLTLVVAWLAIRDGGWRRARWPAAALALTRPHLACVAVGLAALEMGRGRLRSAVSLAGPTIAAIAAWLVFAHATGGTPLEASRRIQALCQFGTAYEADLWRALPAGTLRATLERAHDAGRRAYGAATTLTGRAQPWNPGGDWHPVAAAASAMVRADPLGYAGARLRLVPAVYRYPAGPWPILASVKADVPPNAWVIASRVAFPYQRLFYGSFGAFALLVGIALWNGWGIASAVTPMRAVVVPMLAAIVLGTALLSLSDYEIGRLGLPAHPLVALVWALSVAGAVSFVGALRRRGTSRALDREAI